MHTLALVGGIVALSSHGFWIWGIVRGTLHLNLATWILWFVIDGSILLSSLAAGAPAPFLSIGFVIGAGFIAATLLFKGSWSWGTFEMVCSVLAFGSIIVWYFAGPLIALMSLSLGKYAVAGFPTLRAAYQRPEHSQSWIWWIGTFSAATNIFATGGWTLEQSFFPTLAFLFTGIAGIMHMWR